MKVLTAALLVLVCRSDSAARLLLCNTEQFNVFYGGKSCPYDQPQPPLQNERDLFRHAVSASVNEPVRGVRGSSPLMKLSHPQMINGFIPEYQHRVFLRAAQQLSTLWFDAANNEALHQSDGTG